ncbi:abrupt-like 3 [Homarus americanus]|uniref:Abrupt-like 3 n=1 Tax=Homarus americanus TaxID=6706 RepID=A0A8J5K5X6_HOMAM|nr:abrupt-like 3 [Homarus americanus]
MGWWSQSSASVLQGSCSHLHRLRGRRSLLHTACVCPYCNKVISNKYNLKTHILDKHTVQTERFPCELCGRIYSTKHSLATHTSTVHRGDRAAHHHHARTVPATHPSPVALLPVPADNRQQQPMGVPQPLTVDPQMSGGGGPVPVPTMTSTGSQGPSLAEVAAQLPPAPLEGGPTHEQIQAMAQSLAQSLPSFQSFPGLE